MRVALLQTELVWENSEANRSHFFALMGSITEPIDLVVLPEMFSTGFTMNPQNVAETMNGETVSWMKSLAAEKQVALCGSVVITENNAFYNRFVFVFPSGEIQHYDKRHLFTLAGEDKVYAAGTSKLIIEYHGYRICPQVCYDLRFPVFARNKENYDVLIYVANWPEPRIHAWDTLLKARAIENMSYVVGVNRVGKDANGHHYPGHSQILDYLGNPVTTAGNDVIVATLDKKAMLEARHKFGFLNDRDDFTVA
jgi:omega-amidase